MEASTSTKDPRLRKYTAAVERILQTFDAVNEWADFIRFLSSLAKVLAANIEFKEIPMKLLIAKRLAQCLNPALPSGVHSKCLEVYSLIFNIIGPERLASDLRVYSFGLFPLLQYASMAVKPQVIRVYKDYYIPLKHRLHPCIKGLVLALLPDLEEESNEHFQSVIELMDDLQASIGSAAVFYKAIFLAVLTSPQQRLAAVNYLLKRFPELQTRRDVNSYLGDQDGVDIAINALSAALADSNMLVQRGILDILLGKLPISNDYLSVRQRVNIVKAVLCVVLRKDMSLNRRVYAWLLGPGEFPSNYSWKAHPGCEAIRELLYPNTQLAVDLTRAYKVMVSLLDHPVLGPALLAEVFEDFLRSWHQHSKYLLDSTATELTQTFNMLLALVDPMVIWKCIIRLLDNCSEENLALVQFFLDQSKFREYEENSTIHYPALALFAMDKLEKSSFINGQILEIILKALHSIQNPFYRRLSKYDSGQIKIESDDKVTQLIKTCYLGGETVALSAAKQGIGENFFHCGLALTKHLIQKLAKSENNENEIRKLNRLTQILLVLSRNCPVALRPRKAEYRPNDPAVSNWILALIECAANSRKFELVDLVLQLLFDLIQVTQFLPADFFHSRQLVFCLIHSLWRFLGMSTLDTDLRVVQNIWKIYDAAPPHTVEDFISSYLVQDDWKARCKSFTKFGIFWRISDGVPDSSIAFTNPLFIMVNLLKHNNPQMKRHGEMFLKSSLKSLSRLLDPIFLILLDPSIFRSFKTLTPGGASDEFRICFYMTAYNSNRVNHVFEILFEVLTYAGPDFVTNMSKLQVETGSLQKLIEIFLGDTQETILFKNSIDQQWTYLEILLTVTLQFILSELDVGNSTDEEQNSNTAVQCHAAELFRLILSRLMISRQSDLAAQLPLSRIQGIVMQRLLFCIRTGRLEIQPRLLSVLHLTFLSFADGTQGNKKFFTASFDSITSNILPGKNRRTSDNQTSQIAPELSPEFAGVFLPIVREAFNRQSNKTILPYYADFLNITIPYLKSYFKPIILPVLDIVLSELEISVAKYNLNGSTTIPHDLETIMLLNSLAKLFRFSWLESTWGALIQPLNQGRKLNESSIYGLRGLTDMVTGVFTGDSSAAQQCTPEQLLKETLFHEINRALSVLKATWLCTSADSKVGDQRIQNNPGSSGGAVESVQDNKNYDALVSAAIRIRRQMVRLMEEFFDLSSNVLVECIAIQWVDNRQSAPPEAQDCVPLDILESIRGYQPKAIIFCILELIKERMMTGSSLPHDRVCSALELPNIRLAEAQLLQFLAYYAGHRTSVEALVEVYPQILTLIKDYLSQPSNFKSSLLYLLKAYNSILTRLPSSYVEDKRFKRETYDAYQKLIDCCTWIAGRSFDTGLWRKKDMTDPMNPSDITIEAISRLSPEISVYGPTGAAQQERNQERLIRQITSFFADKIVPTLRQLINEPDRWQTILTSMIYYIITPNLKLRANHPYSLLTDLTLDLLLEIGKITPAYKLWRKEVWDVLLENRFFGIEQSTFQRWRLVTVLILQNEKDRFAELVARISLSSTGIFISKDQEQYNRSQAFKKISFFLLSASKDQLIPYLPAVQEKLVETFKQPYSIVFADAFLCIRLLIFKFSPRMLSSFWPTILTELIRVFEEFGGRSFSAVDGAMQILLSTSKLLDLLVCCAMEQFQFYDWIFVSDVQGAGLLERFEKFAGDSPVDGPIEMSKRRRPLIPITLNNQHVVEAGELAPFLLNIARSNIRLLLHTANNFYAPFVKSNDAFNMERSTAGSSLNEICVDVEYIAEWISADILEPSHHSQVKRFDSNPAISIGN